MRDFYSRYFLFFILFGSYKQQDWNDFERERGNGKIRSKALIPDQRFLIRRADVFANTS